MRIIVNVLKCRNPLGVNIGNLKTILPNNFQNDEIEDFKKEEDNRFFIIDMKHYFNYLLILNFVIQDLVLMFKLIFLIFNIKNIKDMKMKEYIVRDIPVQKCNISATLFKSKRLIQKNL